jgi:hypothetical protein
MKTTLDTYRSRISPGRTSQAFAAFAVICGLSLSAHAQLGSGWTNDNETYFAQNSSGTTTTAISGGYEFTIPTESGLCRAEMRGNNLPSTTTNQWQGLGTLKSFPSGSNKICMHQVFGPEPSTPDLILDEAVGGSTGVEIMSLEQSDAVEASISVGVQFQLNTIYDPVGNLISIYVNGTLTGTKVPNSGIHYNKYGQYVSSSGAGPSTFDWVNIQSWSGGTAPGSGGTTVATPTFSPAGGTYTSAQSVSLSDSTSGATIYYTTNGTTPTTSSAVYSGAIAVSSTTTIEAMGALSGDTNSSVASATYTINTPATVATPTFSPAGGTYTSAQTVSISDSTSGATIYYTTNGTTPTTSSTVYSSAIAVSSGTVTIEAMGAKSGDNNSSVASATYTISTATTVATPTFSPAGGTYTSAQTVSISDSTSGATIYYTTNGTTPTTSSTVYSSAIAVSSGTVTIEAMAAKSGDTNSSVASAAYTISTGGGGCKTATSSWTSVATSSVSGTFTATFSVTPGTAGCTAYIGMTNGSVFNDSTSPWLIKLHSTGNFQAINGSSYSSTNTVNWVAGTTYQFSVVVNLTAGTYSVYVTPAGGSQQTLATNFAVQVSASSLNYYGLQDTASSLQVCNFAD